MAPTAPPLDPPLPSSLLLQHNTPPGYQDVVILVYVILDITTMETETAGCSTK